MTKKHHDAEKKHKVPHWQRPDNWAIVVTGVGAILLMIGMFIPRWRVDIQGTTNLEKVWAFASLTGWKTKQYGLLQVQGSYRQSWSTIVQSTCDFRTYAGVSTIGQNAYQFLTTGSVSDCTGGSEQCSLGFFDHMNVRCQSYGQIWKVSSATLAISFIAILAVAAGVLVGTLSKREQFGGVSFGLFLFAGIACLIMNIAWAGASDSQFRAIMATAWYPYPQLGIGWFLHLFGSIMVLWGSALYGWVVLPDSWLFDPTQHKIDKRQKKLQKMQLHAAQEEARHQQQQLAMNYPQPPGFGQVAPGYMGGMPVPGGQQAHGGYGQDFGLSPTPQQYGQGDFGGGGWDQNYQGGQMMGGQPMMMGGGQPMMMGGGQPMMMGGGMPVAPPPAHGGQAPLMAPPPPGRDPYEYSLAQGGPKGGRFNMPPPPGT